MFGRILIVCIIVHIITLLLVCVQPKPHIKVDYGLLSINIKEEEEV